MFKSILAFLLIIFSCPYILSYGLDPEWSLKVANMVNPYFSLPYEDASNKNDRFYSLACPDNTVVYRPNHSLAHGLRQSYLASDIAVLFSKKGKNKEFVTWIKNNLKNDPNFLKKVEMANAFQRTGRKSEISRSNNKEKYESYLLTDQENFKSNASKEEIFKSQEEINLYARAITEKFDNKSLKISDNLYFLSKIFFSAHLFDLRRLPDFSKDQIRKEISLQLFDTDNPNDEESRLFDKLWKKAGDYLAATGDRDMDDPNKKTWNTKVFCEQAHNPELLVKALQIARNKPEEKLFKSILKHAQVIREIKEKSKIISKSNEFANLPYTASEAYLKILLGKEFIEIPPESTEVEAHNITNDNVNLFLLQKKRFDKDTKKWLPRVQLIDKDYVDALVEAMMQERQQPGKLVFYHTTEPETGFLYDVYTELRNMLHIEGAGNEIRALRAIDKEFIQLNEEVNRKATVIDFMTKFKGVADSDNAYRTLALSTNFGLFGSDQQIWADTYNLFYLVKNARVATQPLKNDTFFGYIEQYTGIPMDYKQYEKILNKFVLTCDNNQPCRNGRLIQIFVEPSVIDDMAYPSVLMGAPVIKDNQTPKMSEVLKELRTDPDNFVKNYLQGTKATYLESVPNNNLRLGQLELHDLQARLFMRPDIMFDRELVTIKSYFRFDLKDKIKDYYNQIKKLVNKNLVAWFKVGAPSDPDAFQQELIKLKTLVKGVYKKVAGKDATEASPVSLEDQLVKLLLNNRDEQAVALFEENYEALKDEVFTIPARQDGSGFEVSELAELYRYLNFAPLYKAAFLKGLFPGGEEAYKVISVLHRLDHPSFINILLNLKDPTKSCQLFLKYFDRKSKSYESIELIKSIGEIDNNEKIIEQALPLLKLFEYDFSDRVLQGIWKIPSNSRKKVIEEALLLFANSESLNQDLYRKVYIREILAKIYDFRDFSQERQRLIWSVTMQLFKTWDDRLEFIKVVMKTDQETLQIIDDRLKNSSDKDYKKNMKKMFKELSEQL